MRHGIRIGALLLLALVLFGLALPGGPVLAAEGETAKCESLAAVLRADKKSTQESLERMLSDIAEQENRVREVRKNIDEAEAKLRELDESLKKLNEENVLADCVIA